jgi:hypothetical protein
VDRKQKTFGRTVTTVTTGQEEKDRENKIAMTGLPG